MARVVRFVPAFDLRGQLGPSFCHHHDPLTDLAQCIERVRDERASAERRGRLRGTHSAAEPAGEHRSDHRTTRTVAAPWRNVRFHAMARRFPTRLIRTLIVARPRASVCAVCPAKRTRASWIAKRPAFTRKRNVVVLPRCTRRGETAMRSRVNCVFTPATADAAQSALFAAPGATVSFTSFAPGHARSSSTCDPASDATPAP